MPSIILEHLSEPVKLTVDDDNPYEPPRLTSTGKSFPLIETAKAQSINGEPANEFLDGGQLKEDVVDVAKLQSEQAGIKVNGNGNLGTESSQTTHSRKNSRDLHRNKPDSTKPGGNINAEAANGDIGPHTKDAKSVHRHSHNMKETVNTTADAAPSKKPFVKGHGRAHSSSTPTTPTTNGVNGIPLAAGVSSPSRDSFQTFNKALDPSTQSQAMVSPAKGLQPKAPRLVSRHTLEVPRVSTSRNSRDFSLPNTASDVASDTGRNSPTPRTPRASHTLVRAATRSVHSDLFLDDMPQGEDMARWTETVRQKRASRRKRKEEEEEDRVVVGTKVDMNHVNWVTAYNMLTGIRFTVSRTNAKIDRELTDADFDAKNKFSFDITGNELTPSAKYDFKFKDYAPWVFRHLRARFKRDPADYLMSLTSKYILSELGSPGKSGSFFYFSRDYKYIIKTIHHAEHKLLRKILREYYAHIDRYPNTLISQFYGLHRVKIPYGRKIHFVVMNNLFPPHRDIHQTFDLKGSTIGRDFKEEDLAKNPRATLKDLNWLRRNYHFEFGPDKKALFVEQMKRDVRLLQKLKIMDYSLLVGIHDLHKGNEENLRDKTLQVFQPGGDGNNEPQVNMLTRTPSKLENARQARQLRQIIKKEKPVPMDKSTSKMPDEILEERKNFVFYSDDGGFRATHEDGQPGEEIYYLGIIDCLTHYGIVKKAEHLWKGLSHNKSQISPIPPEGYGDRFVKFISGLTKTREEADREVRDSETLDGSAATTPRRKSSGAGHTASSRRSTDRVIEKAEKQAEKSERDGANEDPRRDRTLTSVRSPSAERSGGVTGATLPVVEEAGEAGSREESVLDEKGVPTPKGTPSQSHGPTAAPPVPAAAAPGSDENGAVTDDDDTQLPSIPHFNRLSMGMGLPAPSPT